MLRERLLGGRTASTFTLQWHLTNRCGSACAHCYDRAARAELPVADALRVLDDLDAFCAGRRVRGQVSLTGGDPLLYPGFLDVYADACRRGLAVSILGNAASEEQVDAIVRIRAPRYWQVSLEGLPERDDAVRGAGHFARTIAFLELLRARGVPAHVMLTLTRDNAADVLPLADRLRGLVDRFSWTRLAQVGNGAALAPASREELASLSRAWLDAGRDGGLGMKEGLLNVLRHRDGRVLLGGCTGHGCGAAFSFVALLPDGEVHACRKFPSPIGDVRRASLTEIWRSPEARAYRAGSAGCAGCPIRARCGGCLAVAHGRGLDPLRDRDPDCFFLHELAAAPAAAGAAPP